VKWIETLLIAAGVALLAVVVSKIGWGTWRWHRKEEILF
jgi:hypothetical protein